MIVGGFVVLSSFDDQFKVGVLSGLNDSIKGVQLHDSLTPCAGKCSTVFGDHVCRGCRRFSYEVIEWNRYTGEQKLLIWQRLDEQLDRIVLPLIPDANLIQVDEFLASRQVRLLPSGSAGRHVYEALRACQRNRELLPQSGLNIATEQFDAIWQQVDSRLYTLAVANFEFAWLRAANFGV